MLLPVTFNKIFNCILFCIVFVPCHSVLITLHLKCKIKNANESTWRLVFLVQMARDFEGQMKLE